MQEWKKLFFVFLFLTESQVGIDIGNKNQGNEEDKSGGCFELGGEKGHQHQENASAKPDFPGKAMGQIPYVFVG